MYASKTRKEKFPGPGENCQRNVTDLAGSLVTSSRPPGRPKKRPDDRTWNAGVAVRTADGSRRTADAGDEQCLRCGCSSPSCTVVLCAADVLTVTSISKVIRQKAASLPLRSTFSSGLFDLDRSLIHGFSGQHERVHVCGSSGAAFRCQSCSNLFLLSLSLLCFSINQFIKSKRTNRPLTSQ